MSPSVQTAGITLKHRSLVSNWATHPMVIENESCEMLCEMHFWPLQEPSL